MNICETQLIRFRFAHNFLFRMQIGMHVVSFISQQRAAFILFDPYVKQEIFQKQSRNHWFDMYRMLPQYGLVHPSLAFEIDRETK